MVTVFLADGFEEMEALAPIDLLRRAGVQVQTAAVGTDTGVHGGRMVTGSHGITFLCDTTAAQIEPDAIEMIVLPGGGRGTENLDRSPLVDRFLAYADQHEVWVGAICAAPSILGKRGLLDGRKATSYPGFEPVGAVYTGADAQDSPRDAPQGGRAQGSGNL